MFINKQNQNASHFWNVYHYIGNNHKEWLLIFSTSIKMLVSTVRDKVITTTLSCFNIKKQAQTTQKRRNRCLNSHYSMPLPSFISCSNEMTSNIMDVTDDIPLLLFPSLQACLITLSSEPEGRGVRTMPITGGWEELGC